MSATLGSMVIASVVNDALDFHVRGGALQQTIQERPLLSWLNSRKQTFPGGKEKITTPIQGTVMADSTDFLVGYTNDQALTFNEAGNTLRPEVVWKEVHAGLIITHSELKRDGISVTDGESRTSEHSDVALTRLTGILENRLADFSESWGRSMNTMLWNDGSQDSKQIPGIQSLLTLTADSGTVEGLSKATYAFWRSRLNTTLVPSSENQTISKFFRNEVIQLVRFGGRPDRAFCGSGFWDALMQEVEAKGQYTVTGFEGGVDIGLNRISIKGIGVFEYDPTLDTLGLEKHCFVLDGRRTKLRPMEGEENKTMAPARPYNYMVLLKSMTYTGGLITSQLNSQGRYAIA